jgi:hypothetical protein
VLPERAQRLSVSVDRITTTTRFNLVFFWFLFIRTGSHNIQMMMMMIPRWVILMG